MPRLSVEHLPESLLFEPTTPTLLDPPLGPLPSSRLTELSLSRMSSLFLDPHPELDPLTRIGNQFLDPLRELDPSTKTENDLNLGSVMPLVPASALVEELLLLARLSLMIDNDRFNNTTDSEVFLSTMIRTPIGPCLPTGLNHLSVTDPSLTS